MRSLPGLRFVTASDLPAIYPDAVRLAGASEQDLGAIAARLAVPGLTGVDAQAIEQRAYSAADQFGLLTAAVSQLIAGRKLRFPLAGAELLGPDQAPPPARASQHLDWPAFRDTTLDVLNFIETQKRVPSRVFVGAEAVPPADYLAAVAAAYDFHRRNGKLPTSEGVTLGNQVELLSARHIAQDTPGLFGGWIIHPEGFRAPKILEVARLQAWTLKPAMRKD